MNLIQLLMLDKGETWKWRSRVSQGETAMCDRDRDRSDEATEPRNRVLWELGEQDGGPTFTGALGGHSSAILRVFIFGLQRRTPVFSHWL